MTKNTGPGQANEIHNHFGRNDDPKKCDSPKTYQNERFRINPNVIALAVVVGLSVVMVGLVLVTAIVLHFLSAFIP